MATQNTAPYMIRNPKADFSDMYTEHERKVYAGHPEAGELVSRLAELRADRAKLQAVIDSESDPQVKEEAAGVMANIDAELSDPTWTQEAEKARTYRAEDGEDVTRDPITGRELKTSSHMPYQPPKVATSGSDMAAATIDKGLFGLSGAIAHQAHKILPSIIPDPETTYKRAEKLNPGMGEATTMASFGVPGGGALFKAAGAPFRAAMGFSRLSPAVLAASKVPGLPTIARAAKAGLEGAGAGALLQGTTNVLSERPTTENMGMSALIGGALSGGGEIVSSAAANMANPKSAIGGLLKRTAQAQKLKDEGRLANLAEGPSGGLTESAEALAKEANEKAGQAVTNEKRAVQDALRAKQVEADAELAKINEGVEQQKRMTGEEVAGIEGAHAQENVRLAGEAGELQRSKEMSSRLLDYAKSQQGAKLAQEQQLARTGLSERTTLEKKAARDLSAEQVRQAKEQANRELRSRAAEVAPEVLGALGRRSKELGEEYGKQVAGISPSDVSEIEKVLYNADLATAERHAPNTKEFRAAINKIAENLAVGMARPGDFEAARKAAMTLKGMGGADSQAVRIGTDLLKAMDNSQLGQEMARYREPFKTAIGTVEEARGAISGNRGVESTATKGSSISSEASASDRLANIVASEEGVGGAGLRHEVLAGNPEVQQQMEELAQIYQRGQAGVRKAETEGRDLIERTNDEWARQNERLRESQTADTMAMHQRYNEAKSRMQERAGDVESELAMGKDIAKARALSSKGEAQSRLASEEMRAKGLKQGVQARMAAEEDRARKYLQQLDYEHGSLDDQIREAAQELPSFRGKEGEDIIQALTDRARSKAEDIAIRRQLTKSEMEHLVEVIRTYEMVNPKSLAPFAPMLAGRRNSNLYAHIAIPIRVRILAPAFKNLDDLAKATGISREWLASMTMRANQASPDTVDKAMEEVESRFKPAQAVSNPVPSASPPAPSRTEDEEPYFQP